jgi:hypothetical protein
MVHRARAEAHRQHRDARIGPSARRREREMPIAQTVSHMTQRDEQRRTINCRRHLAFERWQLGGPTLHWPGIGEQVIRSNIGHELLEHGSPSALLDRLRRAGDARWIWHPRCSCGRGWQSAGMAAASHTDQEPNAHRYQLEHAPTWPRHGARISVRPCGAKSRSVLADYGLGHQDQPHAGCSFLRNGLRGDFLASRHRRACASLAALARHLGEVTGRYTWRCSRPSARTSWCRCTSSSCR